MFYSTRNRKIEITASQAIIKGISEEGGLFLPKSIPSFQLDKDCLKLSYKELAVKILSLYLDDYTKEEIESCVNNAYSSSNFYEKVIGMHHEDGFSILELFHGPTVTFKDMALSLLPHLMEVARKKNNIAKPIMILTATSGDTGSAALANFANSPVHISVLYPDGGISSIQERQMLAFSTQRARAYAMASSNFDDCQTLVKSILNSEQDKYHLSSANSINIGRLIPQIVYYYASYIALVNDKKINFNDEMDVIVPTGNFGNIFACYLAKKMGLPVRKLVCASNENRVLTDFFETGVYSLDRKFIKTNSPSMDILISSNLERFLSLNAQSEEELVSYMRDLKEKGRFEVSDTLKKELKVFEGYSIDQVKTLEYIKHSFEKYNYLMDPHTAVAYGTYIESSRDIQTVIVSTASPFKFPDTILEAFGVNEMDPIKGFKLIKELTGVTQPKQIDKILNNTVPKFLIESKDVRDRVLSDKLTRVYDEGLASCVEFKKSDKDESFCEEVLRAYQFLFKKLAKEYIPVSIQKVELAPSLGVEKSNSAKLLGLLGANELLNRVCSLDELKGYIQEI